MAKDRLLLETIDIYNHKCEIFINENLVIILKGDNFNTILGYISGYIGNLSDLKPISRKILDQICVYDINEEPYDDGQALRHLITETTIMVHKSYQQLFYNNLKPLCKDLHTNQLLSNISIIYKDKDFVLDVQNATIIGVNEHFTGYKCYLPCTQDDIDLISAELDILKGYKSDITQITTYSDTTMIEGYNFKFTVNKSKELIKVTTLADQPVIDDKLPNLIFKRLVDNNSF